MTVYKGRPCGLNPLSCRASPTRRARAGQPAFMPRIKARRFLWGVVRLVQAVTCVRRIPRHRRELHAGSACRASPLLCALAASAACGDSMGSDTFYNEQALLWGVVHLAWAVTCVRRIPRRRRGRACGLSLPLLCAAIWRRSFLWEVGTSYNERRFL